jgi:hypothetical protein
MEEAWTISQGGGPGSNSMLHCWNPGWESGLDNCAIFCFGAWEGLNGHVGHSQRNIALPLG